jgi:DNA-binding response OmpR family regulator
VGAPRIVVVDDDLATQDLLREILNEGGYAVETAPGVDPSLHEIRDASPDLIVIDLLLSPDPRWLSGWDAVRLARSHADLHRLPILVISADPGRLRSHAPEAGRMGRIELLTKPFGVDELLEVVGRLLPLPMPEDRSG